MLTDRDHRALHRVQPGDFTRAGEVLAAAFRHDPLWERVFGDEAGMWPKRCAFFETPVRYCRVYGEAWASSSHLEGIAAWAPGPVAGMSFWRMLRSGALRSGIKLGAKMATRTAAVFGQLETDRREHMQGRRFLHLQVLGVAPEHQGHGFGTRLLSAAMAAAEEAGAALYLETETEANVEMYRGHGFRVLKEVVLPHVDLPMWEMVRDPGVARGGPPGPDR